VRICVGEAVAGAGAGVVGAASAEERLSLPGGRVGSHVSGQVQRTANPLLVWDGQNNRCLPSAYESSGRVNTSQVVVIGSPELS
jgi:hypothetical protein